MNLRRTVYTDCVKILNSKYRWIDYPIRPYPPFKLPDDPTQDIRKALSWKITVNTNSKGIDLGDDSYAVRFRDEGTKIYRANANSLSALTMEKGDWFIANRPCKIEVDLAIERWNMLEKACYDCRLMMRKLYYNDD